MNKIIDLDDNIVWVMVYNNYYKVWNVWTALKEIGQGKLDTGTGW